jgi:hypothetical protein
MRIITYYTYDKLFNNPTYNNIILPPSFLYSKDNTVKFSTKLLADLDQTNAICYSSFLNMASQVYDAEFLIKLSVNELRKINVRPIQGKQSLLFNRDTLLKIITLLISNNKGAKVITGDGNEYQLRKLYQAISAINTIKSENTGDPFALFVYILRNSPHIYGSPSLTAEFYQRHIKRYWHIYKDLFDKLPEKEKKVLNDGIKCLEKNLRLTVKEYFLVLIKVFIWFLLPCLNSNLKGFEIGNSNTFYIKTENFPNSQLIDLIKNISLDLMGMKSKLPKDNDKLFEEAFTLFFDYPIFKVNENLFCIIDLRSLMERSCTGFIWTIRASNNDIKFYALKSQYGNLLESYFHDLLGKIVGETNVVKSHEEGVSDAIIRHNNISLIFEFTTEYYTMASLNNSNKNECFRKLDEILFNNGKGKINNIGRYNKDEREKNHNNLIIPILVTEKYLGDTDLLNLSGYNLKEKIGNIEMPLILSIDDLEIFWSFLISDNKKEVIEELINCLTSWRAEKNKNKFSYNIGFYIKEKYTQERKELNPDYNNFFSINKLLETIEISAS